uniref:Uncharacterized protein n=1 Tax=Mycena chlorophos TaxID=658473 RepID=A0ABQ0LJK5_MYCCL|nr:predicted protein [Mycena chlorophos]
MSLNAKVDLAQIDSFPPILDTDHPPANLCTPRAADGAETPLYILGWLVPRNHLWSLKLNGQEKHCSAPFFVQTMVKPLFTEKFPDVKGEPRGLSLGSQEYIVYLTLNGPQRCWLDGRQAEIVEFVKDTLKLPNEPKWYRTPFDETMKTGYHDTWPNAYWIEYDKEQVDLESEIPGLEIEYSDDEE